MSTQARRDGASPICVSLAGTLLLVSLSTVLVSCARNGNVAVRSSATAASATAAPSVRATPVVRVTQCRSTQLHFQLWRDNGSLMQQPAAWFGLTNVSEATCTLFGYPGLQLLDRSGQVIDFGEIRRGGGYQIDDPKPHLVRLAPGDRAFFGFSWTDANMLDGGSVQGCRHAGFARAIVSGDPEPMTSKAALDEVICPNLGSSPPSSGESMTAVNVAAAWARHAARPPATPSPDR